MAHMTNREANKMVCPYSMSGYSSCGRFCVGEKCMAWQFDGGRVEEEKVGYCSNIKGQFHG